MARVEVLDATLGDLAAMTVGIEADPAAGTASWGLQSVVVEAPDGLRWAFPCHGPGLGDGDRSTRQRVLVPARQAVVWACTLLPDSWENFPNVDDTPVILVCLVGTICGMRSRMR